MKMLQNFHSLIFVLFLFTVSAVRVSGQRSVPADVKSKIDELKSQVEKYKADANKREEAKYLNQLAFIYWEQNFTDQAIGCFERSLQLNEELDNQNAVKNIYGNLGSIYFEQEKYQEALSNFQESLKINRSQKKREGIASDLQNIAQIRYELKQYSEAIKELEEAAGLAMEDNNSKLMQSCFLQLAENYDKIGEAKKSREYFDKSASILSQMQKKQIEKIESQKVNAEKTAEVNARQLKNTMDTLADIKESIHEIQLRNELVEAEGRLKDLEIKEEQSRNRVSRLLMIYLVTALIMMLLILLLIYYQFGQKKKANRLLKEQNQEIEHQRDITNKQNQKITDSISYAQRIQNAILPPGRLLDDILRDYFVLYKPRDIVSGDFYWVTQKENILVLAAADCTGHGVPGAFMSMLGVAFLNEIVNKIVINRHIRSLQANEILNELRLQIINSLHQTGDRDEPRDGMDIALCIIDFDEKKMQFSGAHNPMYLVRNGEIYQYSGDKMPVSFHKNMEQSFTLHTIDLHASDIIYLFSDGIIDQFGGTEGTKFMSKNFKDLLLGIHTKPMHEQQEIILGRFNEWKGIHEQLDDILVIGLRYEGRKTIKTPDKRFNWADKQILIAEDTDVNYFLLSEALRDTKAKLVRVKNGKEAVEFCMNNNTDLILMDINMPEMNGYEATRLIKQNRSDIPVIVQTALNISDEREQSMASGADDYISKPIDMKTFLTKLEKYLD